MQHFTPLAVPAEQSVDPVVVRYAGGEFASYIDTDSAAPFMTGLRAALEAPLHSSQVLNTAIAFSNVVALLALFGGLSDQAGDDAQTPCASAHGARQEQLSLIHISEPTRPY